MFAERLCKGFHCRTSGYCIASYLKCNKLPNCGHGDNSDEDQTCVFSSNRWLILSPWC